MPYEPELIELRTRLGKLEAQVEYLYRHLNVAFHDDPSLHPADDPELVAQLRKGNLIGAITAYRQLHNVSLQEGKAAVEEVKRRLGL